MKILGIESSCDDTCAAVVEDGRRILASCIASSADEQNLYGGVVPEIASRRHIEHISAVAQEEARELMGRMGLTTPLDFKQAVTIVKAAGVPVPPTEELFNHVANVAVLLLDNGFFYLAARCVYIMWRMTGKDELGVLSKSLLME